jgi:hypothetical protein
MCKQLNLAAQRVNACFLHAQGLRVMGNNKEAKEATNTLTYQEFLVFLSRVAVMTYDCTSKASLNIETKVESIIEPLLE